jgi:hypothetical protein
MSCLVLYSRLGFISLLPERLARPVPRLRFQCVSFHSAPLFSHQYACKIIERCWRGQENSICFSANADLGVFYCFQLTPYSLIVAADRSRGGKIQ